MPELPHRLHWMRDWLPLFSLCLCLGCSSLAHGGTITLQDDRGKSLTFDRPAQRVVSLLPSLTESVCALGACHRLVGVDRYSNHPAQVRKLPSLGGGMDPNIEGIVALRPDLVLVATSGRAADRLESLGLRVMALEPKTHADLLSSLQRLDQVFQAGRAEHVWQGMQKDMAAIAVQMPSAAAGKRVYVQVSPAPHAAGDASFIGETLTLLGLKNIVPRAMGVFPQLAPEFVVRADPDIILVAQSQWAALRARPGWSVMKAVRHEHVCAFTPEQGDMLSRPGPRLVEAAQWVLDCMKRLKL